ncbi:MAG: GYD domain-containing protein [Caldithrix sp.]|nr:GYD domain-containing protein [Caldithrix sp.]
MATYVLLTKLSPSSKGDADTRETLGRDWFTTVKEKCPGVVWKDHYALLGPYDFMDIYEAPSEEVAAKVAMITMSKGAVNAETITAIPYKKYLEIFKDVD